MGDKEEVMKFTDEQIQELKQAFALFDMDGSGEVSTDELGTVLATLGQKVSDEELVEIIRLSSLSCCPNGLHTSTSGCRWPVGIVLHFQG